MDDEYIKNTYIAYDASAYEMPADEKEKTHVQISSKGITIIVSIALVIIFIIGGVVIWGISSYNAKRAQEEAEALVRKYEKLLKTADEYIEDEAYDDALDTLEAALDVEVEDHKEVYKKLGTVYVCFAGEEYIKARNFSSDEKYEMALECCENANDYLDDAEDAWKNGKAKFKSDVFYDCSSIKEARSKVQSRYDTIVEDSTYGEIAIELFTNAKELLEKQDYDGMNKLDCSDESNNVNNHYQVGSYGGSLIASISGQTIELEDSNYNGKGIGIFYTYTGFYYYMGEISGGYPNGDGVLFISSSNGDYHVEIGEFFWGTPNGDITYIGRVDGVVTKYDGFVDYGDFDGVISIEREINGELLHGILIYDDGYLTSMEDYLGETEYNKIVDELIDRFAEVDSHNPFSKFSANDTYYSFLFNEDEELCYALTYYDLESVDLEY